MFLWLEPVHQYTPSKGPGMSLHESVRRTHPHWLEESITDLPISVKKKESVFMNKKTQDALDAQIQKKRAAQVVEVSEAPAFTPDIFESDTREHSLVEVNFRDMSARLVESSDAPKITREILETLGKPFKTVEMFYENAFWQVAVRDGMPLELEIKQLKIRLDYADQETDFAAMEERDLEILRSLLSEMLVDPAFSYKDRGEGIPIESRSQVMLNSLAEAFSVVNYPEADQIYQVTVRRGLPENKFALFGDFEWYPVGNQQKKYVDMSDEELSAEMARQQARRQILVPAMIVDPNLTWTQVQDGEVAEVIETPADEKSPYPVELLSERFMRTLNEAHRVVTTPEAALNSLQRFLRSNLDEPEGTDEGSATVEPVSGDGDKAGG